jgi:membrane-associated protease RseP (regulator of RpoE activity)
MSFPEIDVLTKHVSRIFRIEDVTSGNGSELIARYRGHLLDGDTVAAYDELADAVRPYGIMPLFRKDGDKQAILLVPTLVIPGRSPKLWVNVVLFALTIIGVMLTGVEVPVSVMSANGSFAWAYRFQHILEGWPFALAMLGILFTHEMGHYIACRYYKVPATLPYFLPMPIISPFGTLGAFIIMRGIPKNKRTLFDVGVAGPLAGLVVTVPVLFLGLWLSHIGPVANLGAGTSGILEGNSIFYLFAKYVIYGKLLPEPVSMHGLSPFLYWIRYFLTGHPIPYGGMDVQLHSIAWAGWGGLLVTALNLVPVGTLDGGHVAYGLFGEKARRIFPVAVGVLIALIFLPVLLTFSLSAFNMSWLLWVFILFWLGNVRTQPLDDITELDPKRRALGFLVLFIFFLIFTPIPLVTY